MPIVVHSPYSGRQVKVRDEDVERAIRDPDGKVFYVVQRAQGQGHYASPTRKGSPKDEQRYDDLLARIECGELQITPPQQPGLAAIHDATGKPQLVSSSKLMIFILAIIVLLFVVYFQFIAPASAHGAIDAASYPNLMTTPLAQVAPLPANPATLDPMGDETDPDRAAARNIFFLRVFGAGAAVGVVIIYLIAKYGNRKRREKLEALEAES